MDHRFGDVPPRAGIESPLEPALPVLVHLDHAESGAFTPGTQRGYSGEVRGHGDAPRRQRRRNGRPSATQPSTCVSLDDACRPDSVTPARIARASGGWFLRGLCTACYTVSASASP